MHWTQRSHTRNVTVNNDTGQSTEPPKIQFPHSDIDPTEETGRAAVAEVTNTAATLSPPEAAGGPKAAGGQCPAGFVQSPQSGGSPGQHHLCTCHGTAQATLLHATDPWGSWGRGRSPSPPTGVCPPPSQCSLGVHPGTPQPSLTRTRLPQTHQKQVWNR